jgi:hypothetical protein
MGKDSAKQIDNEAWGDYITGKKCMLPGGSAGNISWYLPF